MTNQPLARIDVPRITMHLKYYEDEDLTILHAELQRSANALRERYQDKRILPYFRTKAKNTLRTVLRNIARVQREIEKRNPQPEV